MTTIERLQGTLYGLGPEGDRARLEGLLEQALRKANRAYADFLDRVVQPAKSMRADSVICGRVCSWRICRS